MKKLVSVLLSVAILLCACSACGVTQDETDKPVGTTAASGTITVVDHGGVSVTVPKKIERIAVCGIFPLPSVLTVFFNSAEKIVAMPQASMASAENGLLGKLYPEILNAETTCVSGDKVNTEELLLLDPDVVFYSSTDAATGEALRAAGFAAIGISANNWGYNCIETLNQWISLLSLMFPADDKAQTVKNRSDEMYELVQSRVAGLTEEEKADIFILFQYSEADILTSGSGFFGQWWCDAVGAINVAHEIETENSVAVNLEQVYDWNPEVMLLTNFTKAQPKDIFDNTIGSNDWSGIKAVEDGRVYKMPLGMYRSYTPGVDTPITLLWLAKTVYPELFGDIDVTAEAKAYYLDVFGVELTDAQVESIFTPASDAANGV